MIYVAHRGNISGPNPELENTPEYIMEAWYKGYNVEIDVWSVDKQFYFGHDKPLHKAPQNFHWTNERYWLHAKNGEALRRLHYIYGARFFWHENDHFAVTSDGWIWTTDTTVTYNTAIIMLPNAQSVDVINSVSPDVRGVCSDYLPPITR